MLIGEQNSVCCFRVPEGFRFVQCVLKCVIINRFDTNLAEVCDFSLDIIIQSFDRTLNEWKSFRFLSAACFKPVTKSLAVTSPCSSPSASVPLNPFTNFVGISQTVFETDQSSASDGTRLPYLSFAIETVYHVCSDIMCSSFRRNCIVQSCWI